MAESFIDTIPSLKKRSISSTIIDLVTQHLLSGELKPGDRLPTELEFARRLGVGRNAVREAMQVFAALGIVDIRRGAGTFIARSMSASMINAMILSLVFEQKTPQALIELRVFLDSGAGELIIQKASDEDLARLDTVNEQLLREVEHPAARKQTMADLDLQFHSLYYELSGNTLLAKIATAVYTLFRASMEKSLFDEPMTAYKNHRLLLDALNRRDAELLRTNLQASLSRWIQQLNTSRSDTPTMEQKEQI